VIPPASSLLHLAIGLTLSGLAGSACVAADTPSAGGSTTVTTAAKHIYDLTAIARWQHADGSWSESVTSAANDELPNQNFCTGMGLLAFIGAGYDQVTPNIHRQTVLSGLTWIIAHQHADGSFPGSLIDNAVQSMALSEAYAMTDDPNIRDAAYRGIQALLARRVMIPALQKVRAWPDADGRFSTRANTFCIMAVKSAIGAQLLAEEPVIEECAAWLVASWHATTAQPSAPGAQPSAFPAYVDYAHGPAIATGSDLHGALTSTIFLSKSALIKPLVASLVPQLLSEKTDAEAHLDVTDRWFRSFDLFEYGSTEQFLAWGAACKQSLAAQQVHEGPLKGGWETQSPSLAPALGATSSSMVSVLTLEVFYRYDAFNPK